MANIMTAAMFWTALLRLLSTLALAWYCFIWAFCLFGLHRARIMFLNTDTMSGQYLADSDTHTCDTSSFDVLDDAGDDDDDDAGPAPRVSRLPGVSILRPLAGEDANLFANLASTFQQDYPAESYEIIFSVSSSNDAALPVARKVIEHYASGLGGVKAQIIVGDVWAGVNPKINNLLRPYCQAQYDILWIVDSQVRLSSTTLRASVAQLLAPTPTPSPTWLHRRPNGSRVGLVHSVPLGVEHDPSSLASLVERVYLSTTHAKMYLAMNALAIDSCVMGKSNLWRKSDLERVPDSFFAVGEDGSKIGDPEGTLGSPAFRVDTSGSTESHLITSHLVTDTEQLSEAETMSILRQSRPLARFSIYLAEDNMVATSLWRPPLSLSHVLASSQDCIARTNVGDIRTLSDYWHRRSRWIRVRRYMVPEATAVEPFTESLLAGLVGWVSLRSFAYLPAGFLPTVIFFLLHCAAWYTIDFAVLEALDSGDGHQLGDGYGRKEEGELTNALLSSTSTSTPASTSTSTSSPSKARPSRHDIRRKSSEGVIIDNNYNKRRRRSSFWNERGKRWHFTKAWMVREALALPIWCWAMWGGNEVNWRGQPYRILSDSRAAQILQPTSRLSSSATQSRSGLGEGLGAGRDFDTRAD